MSEKENSLLVYKEHINLGSKHLNKKHNKSDHLRRAIVTGGHNGRVMLVVKGSTAKVSHSDAGVLHRLLLTALKGKEGEPGRVCPGG